MTGEDPSSRPPMAIHWFRRDLRLNDNAALAAALEQFAQVLPVFLFDPFLLQGDFVAPARLAFLLRCLDALDAGLRQYGSRLVIRAGRPEEELPRLAREIGAAALFFNRDYTPYATRRDAAVQKRLEQMRLQVRSFRDAVLLEPGEVLTKAGTPYTVYTRFSRAWRDVLRAKPVKLVQTPLARLRLTDERLTGLASEPLALPAYTSRPEQVTEWNHLVGGEAAGLERLHRFLDLKYPQGIGGYARQHDFPGLDATSRLSPFLKFGAVSIRAAYALAMDAREQALYVDAVKGIDSWVNELIWREFYVHVLAHFPYVRRGAFKQEYDGLQWQHNEPLFQAWCSGQTGYPLVDAGMRQLAQEGWMHNRARMVVAMFLTKDLLLDWRQGERYFMQHLMDGDLAANNGGWQWSASTGADASPYFRIFNPVSQSKRCDPDGTYIRRYVPELSRVGTRFIHAPWTMPRDEQRRAGCVIGKDYPAPIVDHAAQRQRAIALYKRAGSLAGQPE